MITCKKILLAAVILGGGPVAAKTSVKSQGQLKITKAQGIVPEVVGVIRPQEPAAWAKGMWASNRKERPGALGVEIINASGSTPVDEALLLEQNTQATPRYKAFRCRMGMCQAIPIAQQSTTEYAVTLGSTQVRLRDYGDLCLAGSGPCRYFISSWALNALARSVNSAMPVAPKVFLIVREAEEIRLVDAETSQVWMSLQSRRPSTLAALGALDQAFFENDGRLILKFSKGALLLDFAHDLALMSDSEGNLSLLETGLGGGTIADFKPVYEPEQRRLLLLGGRFAITDRQFVAFELGFDTPFRVLTSMAFTESWAAASRAMAKGVIASLRTAHDSDGLRIANLKVEPNPHLDSVIKIPNRDLVGRELEMAGDKIYSRKDASLALWSADQTWVDLPAPLGSSALRLEPNNLFALRRVSTSSPHADCEWARWIQEADTRFSQADVIPSACDASFNMS